MIAGSAPPMAIFLLYFSILMSSSLARPSVWQSSYLRRQDDIGPDDQSWITKWAAVGDSYASGIGAGKRLNWWCSRYDNAYPNLINSDPRMSGQQAFQFTACSGALANNVASQVDSIDSGQDAITISAGGNDAQLVNLLNECIYTWDAVIGCDKAMASSKSAIQNDLPSRLDNLYSKAKNKLSSQGTAYVTAYAHFFDESTNECDSVSWHWYPSPIGILNYQYLTQARRHAFNELVDMVNSALKDAVGRAGDQFVLVDYDAAYTDFYGRYCEPGVKEPDPNRADLLFYLDGTKETQNAKRQVPPGGQEDDNSFPEETFEGQILKLINEGRQELIDNDTVNANALIVPVPDSWARVFHPLRIGHSVIANRVLHEMGRRRAAVLGASEGQDITDEVNVCPIWIPIPSDPNIGTGNDLNGNFPKYWILSDGARHDIVDLYFKMRDKACQRVCDVTTIQDVPSQFVRADRIGDTGCQYTLKIAEEKEMYFYATNDGQNCYDATEYMINDYGKTKDASWINGPNPYEFYQIGVRDINTIGPGSTTHDPFPLDKQHLGYLHLACRRTDSVFALEYDFEIRISNWDDGDYGRSIMREGQDKCGLWNWRYESEGDNPFTFHDGSMSDHWSSFSIGLLVSDRCGEKVLESVLGLIDGSVGCPDDGRWAEVNVFEDRTWYI